MYSNYNIVNMIRKFPFKSTNSDLFLVVKLYSGTCSLNECIVVHLQICKRQKISQEEKYIKQKNIFIFYRMNCPGVLKKGC